MKLVVAIVQDYDCDRLLRTVTDAGLGATRIASTGGFLRTGNTTVVMGVADDRLTECFKILARSCQLRIETTDAPFANDVMMMGAGSITEVAIGGAVVFVIPVESFVRFPPP